MKKGNGISLSQKELVYCYFYFFGTKSIVILKKKKM